MPTFWWYRVAHGARVVDELDLEVVEVAVAGRPEVHVRHVEGARRRRCPWRPRAPRGVAQHHADVEAVGVDGLDRPADRAGVALEAGDDGDVLDPRLRRRGQPHGAVQAGVVEEVVPVDLRRCPLGVCSMTPGGMDWKLSVLLTSAVTRTSSPGVTNSVMSASNGV